MSDLAGLKNGHFFKDRYLKRNAASLLKERLQKNKKD